MKDTKKLTVIGVDIAKHVFQLHWVSKVTGEIKRLKLQREKFLPHCVNCAPCLVAMEACSGAHPWARELIQLGHPVK